MQHLVPAPLLQRSRGRLDIAVAARLGATRVERLYQEGCAKALLPRGPGVAEAVILNTAGGLTGGDRLDIAVEAGPGTYLVATSQAAERLYRAAAGTARVGVTLRVGAGARLDWLPQETIFFDRAALSRRIEADLAPDARLLVLETLVLGRAAMGETVAAGAISDQWRIRRGGRLVHAEAVRAAGDLARILARPATLAGARALATLVEAAPGAETRLAAVRAVLASLEGVTAAASARDGLLIVRFLAADHAPLRRALANVLRGLGDVALPRVWTV